jgi:hypothetical protein
MTRHAIHFIDGSVKDFYDVITCPGWGYFKAKTAGDQPVCIPASSVLYVEMVRG